MENKNPQHNSFNISKRWAYIQDVLGVIALVLSMFQSGTALLSSRCFLIITGVLLILEFIFEYYQGTYFDKGHYIRESILLDNSFNEKRIPNYNSDLYFNNDSILAGEIKLLANIHENALFTSKIAEKMSVKYYIGSAIAIGVFIIKLFLSGMDDYSSILLSFIISCSFFKRAFNLNSLKKTSNEIYDNANMICSNYERNSNDRSTLLSNIMELFLKYENTVFESKVILSTKIFGRINKKTTDEWENVKKYYSIYQPQKKDGK